MKIYLVVVNYNCLVNLKKLLPRVLKEDFDAVYVLDDASTDGSADYIAEKFPAIRLIKGTDNRGAGGNRNRIIDERLKGVIFFLDADMELRVRGVGKIIKKQYADKQSAMIGNLILNKSGKPMEWNYGPEMNPLKVAEADVYYKIAKAFPGDKELIQYIYENAQPASLSWYLLGEQPQEHETDWVAEGSFTILADIFNQLGGFDANMRYHEAHDLGRRVRDAGHVVKFAPEVVSRHLEMDVRGGLSHKDWWEPRYYFYEKHWGLSRKALDKLFDSPLDELKQPDHIKSKA